MAFTIIYELWAFIEQQESNKGNWAKQRKKKIIPRRKNVKMHVETHVIILQVAIAGWLAGYSVDETK